PVVSCFDFGHSVADIAALLDPLSKHFIHFNNIEIEGDALALQIVLRNLVDNAIRHSDRRELMIAIDVVENEPGVLTFTVGDNGNGLLGPDIRRINGNETASPAGDSYGFRGVRRLVRSRGGDVWTGAPLFASGATVHFTLPGRILGERTASASRAA
ncbi:MAG: sensor histidine kinase, partial [Rhizobiaceae bacterium]|nr:sensor histidine kinase [Rhizobiaceae bacterium]